MGKRQEMCAFLFDYIGTEEAQNRNEEVHILYSPAYFNWTGVLNKEAQS